MATSTLMMDSATMAPKPMYIDMKMCRGEPGFGVKGRQHADDERDDGPEARVDQKKDVHGQVSKLGGR
jgi:hypothetical protein